MEEYKQITLDEWTQWKEDIRRKLAETAGNFVYIGYRLKQIRDSGMFGGAADIFEFAQKEYGLGKSTVSRFIAINEKYSEGGNSLELREEYRNFSSSKLSEMLTLPDSECQLITERTTVKEIRDLKEFDRQVPETDIVPAVWTPLQKCIIDFFSAEGRKKALNEVMRLLSEQDPEYKEAAEIVNPSGQCSHRKGIVFLFLYDWNTGVKYKLMTEPDPVCISWKQFLENVYEIYIQAGTWENFYGKEEEKLEEKQPEKQEVENATETESNQGFQPSVATSQQEQIQTKEEDESIQEESAFYNSTSGSSREDADENCQAAAGVSEYTDDKSVEETGSVQDVSEEELPGQMDIVDFPECLPEDNVEVAPEQPKMLDHLVKEAFSAYMDELHDQLDAVDRMAAGWQFDVAKIHLNRAGELLDKLAQLPESEEDIQEV